MAEEPQKGVKRRRITQACDYCHQRSIRCRPDPGDPDERCTNCVSFQQECTRLRPAKKRGVKPRNSLDDDSSVAPTLGSLPAAPQAIATHPADTELWRAPHVAGQGLIVDLVEVYFEVVYPIFPLFHRPSFIRKVCLSRTRPVQH
jgi:hypothetical protein